jgi:hypothetical protein
VSYRPEYAEQRSRLTTFFRLFMAIPVFIVMMFWAFCGFFAGIAAWFAILFTGRYPEGLYRFNTGVFRMATRSNAYFYLQTDSYPPFDTGEHPEYPVRIAIAPAQERYSRVKVFFRFFLGIPVLFVAYIFGQAAQAVAFATWLVVVILGRCPKGLFDAMKFLNGFSTRVYGYMFLFTDAYPGFSDDGAADFPAGYLPPGGYGGPGYEQPQYGQPQYAEPQYAQPQYAQPAYGQPPAAPQYAPPADPYAPPPQGGPPAPPQTMPQTPPGIPPDA